jgi:hypothetical protein
LQHVRTQNNSDPIRQNTARHKPTLSETVPKKKVGTNLHKKKLCSHQNSVNWHSSALHQSSFSIRGRPNRPGLSHVRTQKRFGPNQTKHSSTQTHPKRNRTKKKGRNQSSQKKKLCSHQHSVNWLCAYQKEFKPNLDKSQLPKRNHKAKRNPGTKRN